MLFKEVKYVFYLITLFLFIFFVVKFYLSENNVKLTHKIFFQYQNKQDKNFINLPVIKNDTEDIIEYSNEIDEIVNKKQRKFWELFKSNEK